MKKKYYAVAKGKAPGIYDTWDECKEQVYHFSGAVYKSFSTLEEAQEFINMAGSGDTGGNVGGDAAESSGGNVGRAVDESEDSIVGGEGWEDMKKKHAAHLRPISKGGHLVAYVDGSYEQSRHAYSYGCVLVFEDGVVKLNGKGDNEEYVGMRNVAGEILGSEEAIRWAVDNGYQEITIYYDYEGIEKWATGEWKAGKTGTIAYKEFIEEREKEIVIHFEKVAAHTGVEYNELADQLAKEALGIAGV
jgi:ribonuclease HI